MKKLFLFLLINACIISYSQAATISGVVTDLSTCSPAVGIKVYVRDSLYSYLDSATTNTSGAYSITVPSSKPSMFLDLYVQACGATFSNGVFYNGTNIASNIYICGTRKALTGTVTAGGRAATSARVYLIRSTYTPSGFILAAWDSAVTNSFGQYYMPFNCVPPTGSSTWLIKAALLPGDSSYGSYLPTYVSSSLTWSTATSHSYTSINSGFPINISLVSGTYFGGPAFIGGSTIVGANKNSGVGDPLASRMLILTTSSGQAVAHTYSDSKGSFSFTGLAYGTYKMFGDALGKDNPALTFTLTQTNLGMQKIIFEENDTAFRGRLAAVLSVSNTALRDVYVYPNPVTDWIAFTGLDGIGGMKTVVLRSLAGAVLKREHFADGQKVTLNTGNLPAGVYTLSLATERGAASFRILK